MSNGISAKDWQIGKSVLESNRHILEHQIRCDVTFSTTSLAGKSVTVGAHILILSSRSPVFDVMFTERWTNNNSVITIEDVTYENFKEFLRYLYCDRCSISADNVFSLLYTARKYMITQLEEKCVTFIELQMTTSNACTMYQRSTEFDFTDLQQRCLVYIQNNAAAVFQSDDIKSLSQDNLLEIVAQNVLVCSDEAAVYDACIKWAKLRCAANRLAATDGNLRNMLGPVLYKIRLPLMSTSTLGKVAGSVWVLSAEEKGHLFTYSLTQRAQKELKFSCKTRFYAKHAFSRFTQTLGMKSLGTVNWISEQVHSLTVSSSTAVNLLGVTLTADSTPEKVLAPGLLTIYDGQEDVVSVKTVRTAGRGKVDLYFDPVRIIANVGYSVTFKFDSAPTTATKFETYKAQSMIDPFGHHRNRVGNNNHTITTGNPNKIQGKCATTGAMFTFTSSGVDGSQTTPTCGQFSEFIVANTPSQQ